MCVKSLDYIGLSKVIWDEEIPRILGFAWKTKNGEVSSSQKAF